MSVHLFQYLLVLPDIGLEQTTEHIDIDSVKIFRHLILTIQRVAKLFMIRCVFMILLCAFSISLFSIAHDGNITKLDRALV